MQTKKFFLFLPTLFLFAVLLLASGYLITGWFSIAIPLSDLAILTAGFTVITIVIFFIFLRGTARENGSQVLHLLVALSLKLLMELIFALIWFLVVKKTKQETVVLFFILYLAFTMFSILTMLNALKHKSL